MATSSLYGNSSESIGLYGIGSASGGTYFEWFIFYDSATAPATPTGGSWSFTTNTGTAPTGWLASPPPSPTNQVWVSLAIVDSRSTAALTWSTPGLMSSMGSTIANYITFVATSAPAYSSGRLWYDSTQNALSYYNDITNNTIHIGQETQLKVRNTTGATIAKGAPVYVLPTASGFGYPLVALAQADTATKANSIGLANQAIPNNTDGYIVINGLLTGANTGTFAVGDVLYLSPYSAGQLMNTVPPTGYAVRIGVVAFSNTPNGTIYVNESNAFVLAGNIVGTIGITNGGTGATTASGARTSLGLGTVATQDANSVAITGGSITGITDLAIADGGTGASSAAGALANLGAVGLTDVQTLTNKTISGASNTLTNIGNSSLTNSSVTINGSGISLGGTATITAATPNNLVFGSGLSASGNFNGSVATNVTLANVGTAATYGDSGTIPVFTTNAFGQISSVSLQSVVVDSADISGTIAIAQGGTGASSAANARVNLLPSYAGNAGEVLALNAGGTDVEWRAVTGTGTVSSVAVSGGTTGLTTSGGPITAAGTITLAGTLATTNGGTNLTSFTSGGVVYASSTSALTTGSGLIFNGTNMGLGGTPSAWGSPFGSGAGPVLEMKNVSIATQTTNPLLYMQSNAYYNGTNWIYKTSTYAVQYHQDATPGQGNHKWFIAESGTAGNTVSFTQHMTLNTTGLGIGTSSPAKKLDVVGTIKCTTTSLGEFTIFDAPSLGGYSLYQTAGVAMAYVGAARPVFGSGSSTNFAIVATAGNSLLLGSGNALRATLDASGNLGLGVTPSAWSTGGAGSALQVNYASISQAGGFDVSNFATNAYFVSGTGYKYIGTATATLYQQNVGSHRFFTAASGTAGNTITFTQAMTLNASGQLSVGTTSSTASTLLTLQESASNGAALAMLNRNATQTWKIAVDAVAVDDKILAFIDNATATVRLALTDTGNLKVFGTTSVGNATPSTSGAGITFPATQSASSDANTLDDYEEGTWTPSLGGTATYTAQQGFYTKIGNVVTGYGTLTVNVLGTGNNKVISGLPFTSASSTGFQSGYCSYFSGLATNAYFASATPDVSSATVKITLQSALDGTMDSSSTIFTDGTRIDFGFTYRVA
jgi:hypothetical protein